MNSRELAPLLMLSFAFLSANLHAAESLEIDCIHLFAELDEELLFISRGDFFTLIGDGSPTGPAEYRRLLSQIFPERKIDPKSFRLVSPDNHANFLPSLDAADKALGPNAFSEIERIQNRPLRKAINRMTTQRDLAIAQRTKEILATQKLSPEAAKQTAIDQLRQSAQFVWEELLTTHKKAELASRYQSKLQAFGIDFFADPPDLQSSLRKIDPFIMAGIPESRIPYERGAGFVLRRLFPNSNTQKKFELHRGDFAQPPADIHEYLDRAKALAHATDPRIISFTAVNDRGQTMVRKFNPQTHELLVFEKNTHNFASYYVVRPKSETHPRGYDARQHPSPLHWVLLQSVMDR